MAWRAYDPVADRTAAQRILRHQLQHDLVPSSTIHPGDWDWWCFHDDPRFATEFLIDDEIVGDGFGAIAMVALDQRLVATFGCSDATGVELGKRRLTPGPFAIDGVAGSDTERAEELRRLGFEPHGEPAPLFMRATANAAGPQSLPDGFTIRPLRGEEEHVSRAAAARRAFQSTMDPDAHAARYLGFMRSVAYIPDHDLVAVAPDGRVAAFTVFWPDAELSLAQFEPVGTDPDFQRLGLGRAVLLDALRQLERSGIAHARVMTNGDNHAAIALYEACGFERVDTLVNWYGPTDS
jgi:ribosomal protein S18 acetylase RimI-like enzyme